MTNEFDVIARYFSRPAPAGFLGVGDDCALLTVAAGHQLATSTDLLIEGRHFLSGVDPQALGHKALAVNLSDLAAMGAQPLGCLLSLSLPAVDHDWLSRFSSGFHALAGNAHCPLVGGDTTRSPSFIVINVTVLGQVKADLALRRAGAQLNDDIWLTGALGAPDIALRLLQGRMPENAALLAATRDALERPQPPLHFARQLAGVAHAALDISDGLVQDLGHILKASACGAEIDYSALPLAPGLEGLDPQLLQAAVLTGGDVYQLCFTASPQARAQIEALARASQVRATRVGRILAEPGLCVYDAQQQPIELHTGGFDHFL